jgi:tRNA threonylcarbamoyladenosine biosynthesis protein TsaB
MAFILHIDTSSPICSVCIAENGVLLTERNDFSGNKHASVLNALIEAVLYDAGMMPTDLHAIALSGGPGSYTGLRIGTSLAKGLCYGLKIPLIAIPTLTGMAAAMSAQIPADNAILVPMVDARRDDAYLAIYDQGLKILQKDIFLTVDSKLFDSYLRLYDSSIYFGVAPHIKWRKFFQIISLAQLLKIFNVFLPIL